jgi:hypothetical protein
MAVQQSDIKRILAYSTLSQLGYMVMAVGCALRPEAGMFHLLTHAFFKALLFLGAGSVIHACTTSRTSGRWAASKKTAGDVLDVHGRHAGSVRGAAVQRFLFQGRHPGGSPGGRTDRLLHVPVGVRRLARRSTRFACRARGRARAHHALAASLVGRGLDLRRVLGHGGPASGNVRSGSP